MEQEKPNSRLSFFPTPLDDELFDSFVYRYHYLSGNANPGITIKSLFGLFSSWPARMFVIRGNYLYKKLPSHLFIDADDLLNKHSLLPAFRRIYDISIISKPRTAPYRRTMNNFFIRSRCHTHPVIKKASLHCCPICTRSDTKNLGISYWRRAHQLNGAKVCFAHGCDLLEMCPFCRRKLFIFKSMNLPTSFCRTCGKDFLPTYSYPGPVQDLAKLASEALADTTVTTDLSQLAQVVLVATGNQTSAVCQEAEHLYGKKYVYAAQHRHLAFSWDWLQDSFVGHINGYWYSGFSESLLEFSNFAELLMTVHILFGSWNKLDRAMGRRSK